MPILTAREQIEMLEPWRTGMAAEDAYDSGHGPGGAPQHPGPWYHATDHDLPEGTILTPGGGKSQWSDLYDDDKANRASWVWTHHDPVWSSNWGTHTYEVEPLDEGPHPWNGTGGAGYVSPRARVVRRHEFGGV